MSSVIRPARVLVALAVSGLLLAGCGGVGEPGIAAVVGDTRIPVSDVKTWFNDALRKEADIKPQLQQQGQMDDVARQIATISIRQELAAHAARTEKLTVDEGKIDQIIAAAGGIEKATQGQIFTPQNFREGVRAQLFAAELGRKYLPRMSVTFDYTQATTRDDAERKARRMAQGPEGVAAVLAEDKAAGVNAVADRTMRAAENEESIAMAGSTPLFAADPGTVVAFEVQEQSGQWLIAAIKDRRVTPPPAGTPAAPVDDDTAQAVGTQLLALTADRIGVRVSPRYGVWDGVAVATAPNPGETKGFRFAPDHRTTRS